jgi:acyl-CoA thioesterase
VNNGTAQSMGGPEESETRSANIGALLKSGKVPEKMVDVFKNVFGLMERFWEGRPVPEAIMSQNLYGLAKNLPTTQDHLLLTSKTSAEWCRSKSELVTEADQLSALAFYMDGALSFLPLSHKHMFLQDAGACSTLDFALRIFSNKVDLTDWHLKEMKTHNGAEGRTYSEAQLWDKKGNMIASMTQQCVMRPPMKSPLESSL